MIKKKLSFLLSSLASFAELIDPISLVMLTIAGSINACGVVLFLSPVSLYDSGISGTSMFFSSLTGGRLPLSFFLLLLNIPLFLYGLKRQGAPFTIRAVYTVFVYSLTSLLLGGLIDGKSVSPITGDDLLLCAIFGGIVSGVGSGMTIRFGSAIDGVEVLAVIFSHGLNITVGTFVMIYNALLYIVAGFFTGSFILPLYSIVTYMAGLKTIDFIVEGFDKAKAATIITDHPQPICKALSDAFGSGITLMNAHGFFSDEPKTIVYFVVNRFQIARMRTIIHDIDERAFISITEVSDLFGQSAK